MTARRPGFHTVTFGCKLNQFDTAAIASELERRGYTSRADPSDAAVVVVNTCTVTGKADAEARRRIRSLRRASPHCRLLVTGCYAEREADALRSLPAVDHVFGNREKRELPAVLDRLGVERAIDRGCDAATDLPEALNFGDRGDRTRAFLKVQEGCRLACSYCVIPSVRGPSRSIAAEDIVRRARQLHDAGFREIVLTGVNVGDWGRDLDPASDLAALLDRLLDVCGPTRVRLNSLEPLTVTDAIVDLMAAEPRIAPHLQIPLQSGSPAILRAMRRNYRRDAYTERLSRLRAAVPHVGLGADVIVGFPGEDEERFEETYEYIARSPLNYLHVFAWSPRPGTPASLMDGRPHGSDVRRRSARLRSLADDLGLRFRRRFVDRRLDAIVLGGRSARGPRRALTGNFIEVDLAGHNEIAAGATVTVEVTSAERTRTSAVVCGAPDWARELAT